MGAKRHIEPHEPQVSHGGDVTFTITPNPGYSIRFVSDGNRKAWTSTTRSLYTMSERQNAVGRFCGSLTYTITTVSAPTARVTPENPEVRRQRVHVPITPAQVISSMNAVDGLLKWR